MSELLLVAAGAAAAVFIMSRRTPSPVPAPPPASKDDNAEPPPPADPSTPLGYARGLQGDGTMMTREGGELVATTGRPEYDPQQAPGYADSDTRSAIEAHAETFVPLVR